MPTLPCIIRKDIFRCHKEGFLLNSKVALFLKDLCIKDG